MARAPLGLLLLAFSAFLDGHPGRLEPSGETCSPCPEVAESCQGRGHPPACCSSEETPLDQRPCLQGETRREEPSLPSARDGDNWSTILVFIIIASIALVSVGIFFFRPQIRTCLRSCLQQQQIQETQHEEAGPPLGLSVVNFHAFDGASVSTDPRTTGAGDPQDTAGLSPALDGSAIIQCHCTYVGVSKDKVVILSPEVPPDRDLPALNSAL